MRFDLRVPPFARTSFSVQHQAMLEMVSWADEIGVGQVVLSEHHGDPAGFTSAPLTLAAAILGRTRKLTVQISAALVPLHDPVRLAEQLATIDCLAPGRISVVCGAGYRQAEFDMAGIDRGERGARLEECVRVLRAAWKGEPFEWRGREVRVTPVPATPGGPALFVGGKTRAGARRAARLGCGFSPAVTEPDVIAAYFEESARLGFDAPEVYGATSFEAYLEGQEIGGTSAPGFVMVSHDPDATWREIGPYAEYDAVTYAAWQEDGVVSSWAVPEAVTWEHLRESGRFAVVTPEECVALAERDGQLMLHPLMGGLEPQLAWQGLRLFEEAVLPRLSLAAGASGLEPSGGETRPDRE
jgi:alkanesulfonate monooxygenase SsuD/methylene tetrahydromethanopterin reductase-like flavin-dependent oxidoreductase (luciferase family)